MGLRGPGAKAKTKPARRRKAPWERKGLSRVARIVEFCHSLPVTAGLLAGQRMKLLGHQIEFVEEVYGRTDADGQRLVRLAIQSVARGNGKSGFLSALSLAHLCGPESQPRGSVISAANDKGQAGILYSEMAAIIAETPDFEARTNCQRFHKKIEVLDGPGKGSTYEAISADVKTAHGRAPSFFVYDEYGQANDDALLSTLITGGGKRKESLGVIISTQAPDDVAPLSQLMDDALRGDDLHIYCQLIAAPPDADPLAEATWRACNPALGHYLDLAQFRADAERAKRSPSFMRRFRNLRLNQRIAASARLINRDDWEACGMAVDRASLAGARCFGGLDLSAKLDLTALVLVFPGEIMSVLVRCWTPEHELDERAARDKAPYRKWVEEGDLIAVPGKAIDYRYVAQEIGRLKAEFDIEAIAYDDWNMHHMKRAMLDEGVAHYVDGQDEPESGAIKFLRWRQGFRTMSPALEQTELTVVEHKLAHGMHPVLTWAASNAVASSDAAGNRKPDKLKAKNRIDPFVALTMAIGAAALAEASEPGEVQQGLVVI